VCNGNACYADCTSGPPACAANNYCDTVDDHCKPTKPDGQACPLGVECQHFCVAEPPGGSICCNTICNQECHACVTTKTGQTSGTCAIVTPGTDPDNECGSGGMGGAPNMCQGNGQCG
jgi:hypothetical protein